MGCCIKKTITAALVFLVAVTGCATAYKILDYMPRETDVPGWVMVKWDRWKQGEKPVRDLYVEHDIIEAGKETYRSISDNRDTLVEITMYRHEGPLQAFGLFSIDRFGNRVLNHFNDYGYSSDRGFFFTRNDFYVKLETDNQNDRLRQELERFKEIIIKNIDARTREFHLPSRMKMFSRNFSNTDLVYFHKGSPLLPGLKKICMRERVVSDKKVRIFYTRLDSPSEAEKKVTDLQRSAPEEYILAKEKGMMYMIRKKSGGFCMITSYKDYIFGVTNADDINNGKNVLDQLYQEIRVALKE